MSDGIDFGDKDYPGLYQAADAEAINSQRTYYRLLSYQLILLMTGAALALFAGKSPAAILGALVFLGALALSVFLAFKRYDRTWYSARAVAESVKTSTWRYMMRAQPYDMADEEAKPAFLSDLFQILDQNREVTKELCNESANGSAISDNVANVRGLSLPQRVAFYRSRRVQDQGEWYSRKAVLNKNEARKWFITVVVLNGLAACCALLRLKFPSWTYLPTSVFAVAAAAALSWMQGKRFGDLATSYTLAAHEISIMQSQLEDEAEERRFSDLVNDAESAFSREHTQWVARRIATIKTPIRYERSGHVAGGGRG